MTIEGLKNFLSQNNIKPNKTYGQNFLLNEFVLTDIVDSVPIAKGDTILEIGPGIGNLTERLCQTESTIISVEKDPAMTGILRRLSKRFKNFHYVIEDILKVNLPKLLENSERYHVVANIPYYITGKIIQLVLLQDRKPESITLLVQKEVARNVTAKPGSLNLLGISVQLFAEAKIIMQIPAKDFFPEPKVASSVIQITPHKKPLYKIDDEKKFFALLRACFSGKRKQIHNTLSNYLQGSKEDAEKALTESGIKTTSRPQELTLTQWVKLYDYLNKKQ